MVAETAFDLELVVEPEVGCPLELDLTLNSEGTAYMLR